MAASSGIDHVERGEFHLIETEAKIAAQGDVKRHQLFGSKITDFHDHDLSAFIHTIVATTPSRATITARASFMVR